MDFASWFPHHGGEYSFRPRMDLFWLLLEAGVALALLIGIVWWTWPKARAEDKRDPDQAEGPK